MTMVNTFFYSDPHFGHEGIIRFTKKGKKIRPFATLDEMHHAMITNYNKKVKEEDTVFFLGDIAYNEKVLDEIMPQLNGNKRLILGNHDNLPAGVFTKYFHKKLYSWYAFNKYYPAFIACHFPIVYSSFCYKGDFCVHGHIHDKVVTDISVTKDGTIKELVNLRYINVSVEQINYTPIHVDELVEIMLERKKLIDSGTELPYTD